MKVMEKSPIYFGLPPLAISLPVPSDLASLSLSATVPISFITFYLTIISYLNRVNKRRNYKAYALAKTRVFRSLVLLHNVGLACFSGWIFIRTIGTLRDEWPSRAADSYLSRAVDAACRLGRDTSPDVFPAQPTEIQFLTWVFYLSKLYELLDSFILAAKGKHVPILQTYHHPGAIIGFWLAARDVSFPALAAVVMNSGIHAVMYSYFAVTTLHYTPPTPLKKSITTMQLAQFFIGLAIGACCFLLEYHLPTTGDAHNARPNMQVPSATVSMRELGMEAGLGAAAGWADPMHTTDTTDTHYVPCLRTRGQMLCVYFSSMYTVGLIVMFRSFYVRTYGLETRGAGGGLKK
ncbi:ELO family [Aspergillus carlsbadensis]|nr:ELO family [Aspergillus carlsbadensis]